MAITLQNRKILWGRSGNQCAFPECNQELHQMVGSDGSTVIGEECHIEARSVGGPRYNKNLTEKQVDSFDNLILLCPVHHTIIDRNPQEYTTVVLKKMKADHENKVRRALEDKSEFDNLYYESVIEYLDMTLDFNRWDTWTSFFLSADGPMCTDKTANNIDEAKRYILGRVWYGRYPELERAIKDLHTILADFETVFYSHAEHNIGGYQTERFYRIKPYDFREADKLAIKYREHVILVYNLVYELTRAANQICDLTRRYVNPSYRLSEGKLLIYDKCPEYREGETYPGLEEFKSVCKTRDVHV